MIGDHQVDRAGRVNLAFSGSSLDAVRSLGTERMRPRIDRAEALTLWTAGYTLVVLVLVLLAFDFEGRIRLGWTGVLILATLPWSVVSILFAWALIHGAGLGFFTLVYLTFGAINGHLLGRLFLLLAAATEPSASAGAQQASTGDAEGSARR